MELWKKHLNYGTQLQQYLEAVDTPDQRTAMLRYSRPMPEGLLLRALCDLGYIAPRHVFEGTNMLENPANTAPIGTGPFKFVRYERGQYVIADLNQLKADPNYTVTTHGSEANAFEFRDRPIHAICKHGEAITYTRYLAFICL